MPRRITRREPCERMIDWEKLQLGGGRAVPIKRICSECEGRGLVMCKAPAKGMMTCPKCLGLGYVDTDLFFFQ